MDVTGTTAARSLEALVAQYPELRANLFGTDGKLRSFVNVYLNDDDIRYLPEKEDGGEGFGRADDYSVDRGLAGSATARAWHESAPAGHLKKTEDLR